MTGRRFLSRRCSRLASTNALKNHKSRSANCTSRSPGVAGKRPVPFRSAGSVATPTPGSRGVSIETPFPEVYPDTNVPLCCCPPDPQFFGGVAIGGLIGEPFAGEAASGGIVGEPFKGEAASGGVAEIVLPFIGEAASGGEAFEPFTGEAASGGTFDIGEPFIGGIAGGGEFSIGLAAIGGGASGGEFTSAGGGIITDCSGSTSLPEEVDIAFTVTSGTCTAINGLAETMSNPGDFLINYDLTAIWSSGNVTINGIVSRVHIACDPGALLFFWVICDVATQNQEWSGNYFSTDSLSPLALSFSGWNPSPPTGPSSPCISSSVDISVVPH